jgi:murein DD-endopeptidase MepM/ murein hydrolase activator NlpD
MITRRMALGGIAVLAAARAGAATIIDAPPLQGPLVQGGFARGTTWADAKIAFDGEEVPQINGQFLIAFDRDAKPIADLTISRPGMPPKTQSLTIAPRAWRIEHVDAPFHPPAMPDEEFARARQAELARINAARAVNAAADGWRQSFIWPGKARLSGLFGSQRTYRGGIAGSYHSGTDIALAAGTPYVAPADGVVVLAADHPFTLEGNLLMIDHGMGLNSAFLHSSALLVKEGDQVRQGQPIGKVGMTGRATGPHLHWSLRWREARLDPMLIAGAMG